jgi:hypothetical protein
VILRLRSGLAWLCLGPGRLTKRPDKTVFGKYARLTNGTPIWRGYLETTVGQRPYFASLVDLSRMLRERGGWEELTLDVSVEKQS